MHHVEDWQHIFRDYQPVASITSVVPVSTIPEVVARICDSPYVTDWSIPTNWFAGELDVIGLFVPIDVLNPDGDPATESRHSHIADGSGESARVDATERERAVAPGRRCRGLERDPKLVRAQQSLHPCVVEDGRDALVYTWEERS